MKSAYPIFIFILACFCTKHSFAAETARIQSEAANIFFTQDSPVSDSYSDDDLSDANDDDINNEAKKKFSFASNSLNAVEMLYSNNRIDLTGNIFHSFGQFNFSSRNYLALRVLRL
ncbi:MAG: hypothetical protein HY063_13120 [Bacteroidetes bacterium]|nr:hypothetical protein [Bacteroidota bacterium]